MKKIGIGIIGGGLMGREMASAFARWCSLTDVEVQPELVAVADLVEDVRNWFQRIPSCAQITADYHSLLANPAVDVVYVAVPHHLHESIYCDVLAAGKDLFAEKPFGIDLASARRIADAVKASGVLCVAVLSFPSCPALSV
jgi:predicted dehydrogenase